MARTIAYKNLILIGTSHISKSSIEDVEKIISTIKPEIVAIELDRDRYNSLLTKTKPQLMNVIKDLGVINGLFIYFGSALQSYLGKIVGVEPGSEMKTAIAEAKKVNAKVALIDQHIAITIKRLNLKIQDIFFMLWDSFIDGLSKVFGIKRKNNIDFDITKVPEDIIIEQMTNELKERYPKFYRALIEDRNIVMTKNLVKLMTQNDDKKIVAIVGAGHKKEIIRGIKNHFEKYHHEFDVQYK